MNENSEIPQEAILELQNGNMIGAIKQVRSARNIGLKEAKDVVDDYLSKNPEFKLHISAIQSENRGSALKWLSIIIMMAIAGFVLWKFF